MIGLDTNVLVALMVSSSPDHQSTLKWFNAQDDLFVTTYINVGEVLRLISHPRVFPRPLKLFDACKLTNTFIEQCRITVLDEQEEWWVEMQEYAMALPQLRGNDVFDVRIAMALKAHGVRHLATFDRDFSVFSFLTVVEPVAE